MGGEDACRDEPVMTREKSISVDCCILLIYCIGDIGSWLRRMTMPLDKYEDLRGKKTR